MESKGKLVARLVRDGELGACGLEDCRGFTQQVNQGFCKQCEDILFLQEKWKAAGLKDESEEDELARIALEYQRRRRPSPARPMMDAMEAQIRAEAERMKAALLDKMLDVPTMFLVDEKDGETKLTKVDVKDVRIADGGYKLVSKPTFERADKDFATKAARAIINGTNTWKIEGDLRCEVNADSIKKFMDSFPETYVCRSCGGTGWIRGVPCPACAKRSKTG